MKLYQSADGYRYNSSSLAIYDFALKFIKPSSKVLDVGCGCGVLGLLLGRDVADLKLSLLDIQESNIILAAKNARENGIKAELIWGDFAKFKSQTRFDFIVSNPPFFKESLHSLNSHKAISRFEKFLSLESFLSVANSHLAPRGELIFCYDPARLGEILSISSKLKMQPKSMQLVHSKANSKAFLLMLRLKKSAASNCEILPPLFLNDKHSKDSAQARQIYARANLQSLSQVGQGELLAKSGFSYAFDGSACAACAGACCVGESGYIWLSFAEAKELSLAFNMSVDEFVGQFCFRVNGRLSLKEKPYKSGFACIFFDELGLKCGVYELRPSQCRSFPFWGHFKQNFKELKAECPGVCKRLEI